MTTNRAEPGDIETLNIKTKFVHNFNEDEAVFIGVVPESTSKPDGTISLILVQHNKNYIPTSLQACLTLEEASLVIDGLTLARLRMEILQMKPGPERSLMTEVTKEWGIDDWANVARASVGDLHHHVTDYINDIGPDLSTEAGLFEAKFDFEQYMGW